MGVPGLWDILRPTGQVHSLTHLAVESGFVANNNGHRAYRIGIDASIWFFHAQGGKEGENPELRTLFFRCCRLMAMPFLPIFVFDGPKRPKIKRGKAVGGKEHWMVNNLRSVLDAFGFECRTAPGEAEAELAYLNRVGLIDAVLSDDVDCFLFGAHTVIRNSSATLSGNRSHSTRNADGKDDGQHVHIYRASDLLTNSAVELSQGGLILIALLRGGDYDTRGIDGCGVNIAHALARAGFGDTLLSAALSPIPGTLAAFLPTWRAALQHELRTNMSGFIPRKSPALAQRITDSFPSLDVLHCYTHPITSESDGARGLDGLWKKRSDVAKIAHVCEMYFEWGVETTIVKRFRSFLWPGVVLRTLLQAALDKDSQAGPSTPSKHGEPAVETPSKALARTLGGMLLNTNEDDQNEDDSELVAAIHSERRHASTDQILEYRLEIRPRGLVERARSGVQGLRTELADSAAAGGEESDGDEEEDKNKRGTKPPLNPNSNLRVWMPAVMVKHVYPQLVEAFENGKAAKLAKKTKRGTRNKEHDDKESDNPGVTSAPSRTRAKPKAPKPNVTAYLREGEEDTDEESVMPKIKALAKPKTKDKRVETSLNNEPDHVEPRTELAPKPLVKSKSKQVLNRYPSGLPSYRSTPQTLAEDPFFAPLHSPLKAKPSLAKTQLTPHAFPISFDDDTEDSSLVVRSPPTPRLRKYSTDSSSSTNLSTHTRAILKKSPRKAADHTSPRRKGLARASSPSPMRPLPANLKPLQLARSTSRVDEDVIVISSDSDVPVLPIMRAKARPKELTAAPSNTQHRDCTTKKALLLSNLSVDHDRDVIDLT